MVRKTEIVKIAIFCKKRPKMPFFWKKGTQKGSHRKRIFSNLKNWPKNAKKWRKTSRNEQKNGFSARFFRFFLESISRNKYDDLLKRWDHKLFFLKKKVLKSVKFPKKFSKNSQLHWLGKWKQIVKWKKGTKSMSSGRIFKKSSKKVLNKTGPNHDFSWNF